MKKITLWLFALFTCWQINAQVTAYTFASGAAGTLDPMTGSTQILAAPNDDTVSGTLTNIGFTFNYAGVDHTSFIVSPDGWMKLGATGGNSFTNSAANAGAQSPIIMPYWDDLALGSLAGGGQVHYVLTGTAPNRRLIVEWFVTIPRSTTAAANARFQCILNETTNVIEFVYGLGNLAVAGTSTVGLATSATVFNTVTVATNTNSTATFVTNNTPSMPDGTIYTWTPPACGAPGGLNASLVTNSTATISWNASVPVPSIGYEYFFSDVNTPPAGGGTPTVNLSEGLTGLNANTTYYAWVRSDCGAGVFSDWSGPVVFTTLCNAVVAPWSYDVEAAAATTNASIADCWSTIPVGPTTAAYRWNVDAAGGTPTGPNTGPSGANSGVKYFYTEASSGATGAVAELYTPLVDLSGLTDPSLQFFYHMHGANMGELRVDVFDGTTWTNDVFVLTGVQQTANTQPWREAIVSLNAYIGNTVQVRFRSIRGNGINSDMALDDITFDEAPACFDPINLGAANITATTVDVLFTDGSAGNQFDFAYVVQPQGTGAPATYPAGTPEDGSNQINATDFSIPVTGLTPATAYEIYVAADCNGNWIGPINFTTNCVTVTDFVQNFDGVTSPAFPTCWNKVGTTGTANTQNTNSNTAPNTLYMFSSSGTNLAVVAMQPVSNLGAGTHRLRMNMRANFTINGVIEFGYLTNPTDATSFVVISTVTASTLTYQQYIITPPAGSYSDFPAFRHTGVPANSILIDDVVWEEIPSTPPSCATNVVGTPDVACGNFNNVLTWDAAAGADGYRLTIGTTPGGTDILNDQDLGSVLTYSFAGTTSTTYFFTVVPYNANGSATGCSEVSFSTVATGCYCIPTYTNGGGGDAITNVVLGTLSNASTGNVTPFYEDFTGSQPATIAIPDLSAGTTVVLAVTMGTDGNQFSRVWIDFNQNLTFEPSESFSTGTNAGGSGTSNISITIPPGATLGQTRMRIRGGDDVAINDTQACGASNSTWGQTEDYFVNIIAATCSPAVVASSTIVPDCVNGQFSVDIDVTALGDGTPVVSDGTTTWPVAATGIVTVGPFADGATISLSVLHGVDNTCDLPLGNFSNTCPAANDDLCNAIPLVVNAISTGTQYNNIGATAEVNEPVATCFSNGIYGSVWFSFVAPASGEVIITTDIAGATLTDTEIALYDSTGVNCSDLSTLGAEIGCDQDGGTTIIFNSILAQAGLTPGTTYYIQVDVWNAAANGVFGIEVQEVLSSDLFDNNNFMAYPNPVKDVLNLSYTSEISAVQVVNMLGQEVISRNLNATTAQVDMSQLSAGAYIVNVTIGDTVKTIKVVKQ